MRRLAFISIAVLMAVLCMAASVQAQDSVSSFHVRSALKGVKFKVDGVTYRDQATFLWPLGSRHVVEFMVEDDGFQYNDSRTTRFTFQNWTDTNALSNAAAGPIHTVTANAGVSGLTANVQAQHQVLLNFFEGYPAVNTMSPSTCGAPGPVLPNELRTGVVYIDGACYWNSGILWLPAGTHSLNAFPYPGFVFIGWKADITGSTAYLREFGIQIQGPLTLVPRFVPARRVRFRTDPPGLKVMVDRTEVLTTDIEPCVPNNYIGSAPVPAGIEPVCMGEFDFEPGSTHVIGAPASQTDKYGTSWVFQSFANGQGNHSLYTTGPTVYPSDTVLAKFTRGISTTFTTQPPGLKIKINDRDNWGSYSFVYAAGTIQKLDAPLDQTDARGRKYVFKKWSDNGAAAHDVTVPADTTTTFRVIAEYELLSQLIVNTAPLGAEIHVDGTPCSIPCKIDRPDGAEVRLGAPQIAQLSGSHRLDFVSWSDGGAREHPVRVTGAEPVTLNANYRTAYLLTTALDPPEGASLQFQPSSPDGYFPADTVVTVTLQPGPGFRFRRWDGDLAGTGNIATLSMVRPRTIVGRFDRVPFIAPAGIRNAAGQTPEDIVAPGSLVTVFGANLAPYYEVGPANPLSQAIAGTTLIVGNRILPLMFVSPEQINAQLPRDLAPGEHTLRVLRVGQETIEGKFVVNLNAPGLFSQTVDGQAFALARHEDGSPVSPSSPARRGELITLLGTGFGPYAFQQPDGFALPEAPAFEIPQTVDIQAGDLQLVSDWAGGAPKMVGMDLVRFRVPDQLAPSAGVPFRIRLNGHESNTVLLPVE